MMRPADNGAPLGSGRWSCRKARFHVYNSGDGVVVHARSGCGDDVNRHDVLTGSDPAGNCSTAGCDTTCENWTSNGEGSAIVGHHDRVGLKDTRHMTSWNSSHGTRGCSQEDLSGTGGAGLFYCFVAD